MRWDFFRYLLDIHGLSMAGSKDGRGEDDSREISGHRDKDKSQPQLISARNLHHHHQLIVSLTPSTNSTDATPNDGNGHSSHSFQEHLNKIEPVTTDVPIIAFDKSTPSFTPPTRKASASFLPKTTESLPSSPFLIKNGNGNDISAIVDGTMNQNVHLINSRKEILFSPSPSSSSSWRRNANNGSTNEDYTHSIKSSSITCSSPNNQCSIDNSKSLTNDYDSLKIVTVNINCHKSNEDSEKNVQIPEIVEKNGNFLYSKSKTSSPITLHQLSACSSNSSTPKIKSRHAASLTDPSTNFSTSNGNDRAPRSNGDSPCKNSGTWINNGNGHLLQHQHCYNSLSSSTDANNAEADAIIATYNNNKNGACVPAIVSGIAGGGNNDLATEDEASSITSSPSSTTSSIIGVGDNEENDATRKSGSDDGGSTTTSLSNSTEKHGRSPASVEEKPLALFSPSPMIPSSHSTLRWTRAVANQESIAASQTQQYNHQQFYSPQGKCKGAGKQANNASTAVEKALTNEFTRAVGCRNIAAISNNISTGTTLSSNLVTASVIKAVSGGGGNGGGNESTTKITGLILQEPLLRPTSIIGGDNVPTNNVERISFVSDSSGSCVESGNNTLFVFQDKWRVLFDKFDREGFGEITWSDFRVALRSNDFQLAIEPGKLQLLEDLARVHSKQTNSITFQLFVNIVSYKPIFHNP